MKFGQTFLAQRTGEDLRLLRDNRDEVACQNRLNLNRIAPIVGIMSAILSAWYFLGRQLSTMGFAYLLVSAASMLIFLCARAGPFRTHPLTGIYLESSVYMGLAIYLSVWNAPEQKASVLLGLFSIIPLILLDRPWRINAVLAGFLILHMALAFAMKPPAVAGVDFVNTLGFYFIGTYLGNASVRSRLNEMDLRRRSEIEKRLDVLTGIRNRRSLYEQLSVYEKAGAEKPCGALMFDIDDFKSFNDRFGHAAGDECLLRLGGLLRDLETGFPLLFFRYGGDEFVGFSFARGREEMLQTAEQLKERVAKLSVGGLGLTVSIGAVYCGGAVIANYERLIDCADRQLYAAKAQGRNTACLTDYAQTGSAQ